VAAKSRLIDFFRILLDDPEFFSIFEHATSHHKVPIWMHPARDARVADYPGEAISKYEIRQVLGWPYETSVALARIMLIVQNGE
jgi:hypothetical protein